MRQNKYIFTLIFQRTFKIAALKRTTKAIFTEKNSYYIYYLHRDKKVPQSSQNCKLETKNYENYKNFLQKYTKFKNKYFQFKISFILYASVKFKRNLIHPFSKIMCVSTS